jgi:hypothetical protein
MSDIERAEKTLRDLRAKREAAVARGHSLGEERTQLAFGAHALGDTKSKKRLDEINRESALHESELRSLDCAISEAAERVKAAQAVEARKAERARAGAQRAAFERLKLAGQTLDDALAVLVGAGAEIHAAVDTLHVAGWNHPSGQQLLTFGERAIRSAVQQTIWSRCVERLAPNERVSFSHVISQWQQVFERRLGELQKEDAA